jgi:WD40 repeat protein
LYVHDALVLAQLSRGRHKWIARDENERKLWRNLMMRAVLGLCGVLLAAAAWADEPRPVGKLGGDAFRTELPDGKIAFTPDGRFLVHAAGHAIQLFDSNTGIEQRRFQSDWRAKFKQIAVSPKGGLLAAIHGGPHVELWELESGKRRRVLDSLPFHAVAIAFAADGKSLAVSSPSRFIYLFDVETGKEIRRFEGPRLLDDRDTLGRRLARSVLATLDFAILVMEARTTQLREAEFVARGLAFTNDGKRLVAVSNTMRTHAHVVWWEVESGKRTATWNLPIGEFSAYFSADVSLLAVEHLDRRSLDILRTSDGSVVSSNEVGVMSFAFAPDGKTYVAEEPEGAPNRLLRLWKTSDASFVRDLDRSGNLSSLERQDWVNLASTFNCDVVFSPNGKRIAVRDNALRIRMWDAASGKLVDAADGNAVMLMNAQRIPGTRRVIGIGLEEHLECWEPGENDKSWRRCPLPGDLGKVMKTHSFKVSSDGQSLVRLRWDEDDQHHVEVFRTRDGVLMSEKSASSNWGSPVRDVPLAFDGRRIVLAVATDKGPWPGAVYSLATEAYERRLDSPPHLLVEGFPIVGYSPTFSPDSRCVAMIVDSISSSWLSVFETATGKSRGLHKLSRQDPKAEKDLPPLGTTGTAWINGGRNIVVLTHEGLLIFSWPGFKETFRVDAHDLTPGSLQASPDGSQFLVGRKCGEVIVYRSRDGAELARLGGHVGLTFAEYTLDGRQILSHGEEAHVTFWDAPTVPHVRKPASEEYSAERLESLWNDFISIERRRSTRAGKALLASPKQAVALIDTKLAAPEKPTARPSVEHWLRELTGTDTAALRRALVDLDHADLGVRAEVAARLSNQIFNDFKDDPTRLSEIFGSEESISPTARLRISWAWNVVTSNLVRDINTIGRAAELLEMIGGSDALRIVERAAEQEKAILKHNRFSSVQFAIDMFRFVYTGELEAMSRAAEVLRRWKK